MRGSEGSETNVILGFKGPTTIARKKFGERVREEQNGARGAR